MARILLIDDDQTVLDLEKLILLEEEHDVLIATEALLALDMLQLYEVDLIIVDIQMPRFSGFQFVNTIKNNPLLQGIPIAFLSASNEKDNVVRAANLGADFYLVKPIDRDKYLAKIDEFFKKHIPKSHPKIEFQDPYSTEAKIHRSVNIVSISDIGVEILINQELEEGQVIELSSPLFLEVLPGNPLFKVLSVKRGNGVFWKARLLFEDQNIETVRRIQKLIAAKTQGALHPKYPKWR